MATLETPPQMEHEPLPRESARRRRIPVDEEELHLLIGELRDENSRSRLREALWISIILHLVVLFFAREGPKIFPSLMKKQVVLVEPALRDKEMMYLDLPPDLQKAKPVESNRISDKDRTAQTRMPRPDRKLLEQLRDNRRQGAPGANAPQPQQMASATPPPMPQQQPNPGQNAGAPPQTHGNGPSFQTMQPQRQQPSPFKQGMSASAAMAQATQAVVRNRGAGGEYGSGIADPNTNVKGGFEILSDTQGVDFSSYLKRIKVLIMMNWENAMPEEVRPPLRAQGHVVIDFSIGKDGRLVVNNMFLRGPSGDVALDRAAWAGITGSNPFPALPSEFKGDIFSVRGHFFYNMDEKDFH